MSVALFSLAEPRHRALIDEKDVNAFFYTVGLHQAGVALHHLDGAGGRFSVAFTHDDPEAFVGAVAADLKGYLRARHGFTDRVLEAPTLLQLFGAAEHYAALVGLTARARRSLASRDVAPREKVVAFDLAG